MTEYYTMILERGSPNDVPMWNFLDAKNRSIDLLGQEAKRLEALVYSAIVPNNFDIIEMPHSKHLVRYSLQHADIFLVVVLEINEWVEKEFQNQNAKIFIEKLPIVKRLLERTLEDVRNRFRPQLSY